jgi:hypothetical protein
VTSDQDFRGDHVDQTPADAMVQAHFPLTLSSLDPDLFRHHLLGIELTALFYACCNEYGGNKGLIREVQES